VTSVVVIHCYTAAANVALLWKLFGKETISRFFIGKLSQLLYVQT